MGASTSRGRWGCCRDPGTRRSASGTDGGTGADADYTLSLTPAALTPVRGLSGSTTVAISRTNFTGAVALSLASAPVGVIRSFNPAAPTGTNATLTVSVGAAVAP